MDKRQLVASATLAEELSFSRAAARLGMTQPALSMLIAKLEAEIEVRLFNRTKRHVSLTEPGRVFLSETRMKLQQIDVSPMMARRAAEGKLGRLTVGFVGTAPFDVLPHIVPAVLQHLPQIELVLHEMVTNEQIDALQSGRIDIDLLRPMFRAKDFDARLISTEPYMVAIHSSHPLAQKEPVYFTDLGSERLITTSGSKRRYIDPRFRGPLSQAGVELTVAHEIQQIQTIIGLVAGGLGFAVVPKSVQAIGIANVRFMEIADGKAPTSELVIASRRGDSNPIVKRLWSIISKVFSALRRATGELASERTRRIVPPLLACCDARDQAVPTTWAGSEAGTGG